MKVFKEENFAQGRCVKSLTGIVSTAIILSIATSCLNTASRSPSATTTRSSTTAPGTLPNGNSSNFITVQKVVRSNQDPNNMIELIGNNSEIGTYCPSKTDCKCRFNWVEQSGILREADQEPAYTEANMLRCLFTQVTANSSYFDVKAVINAAGLTSNSIRVFMTSPNPSLDPSIGSNYVSANRFLCRDMILKSQNTQYYQGTIVDPRLWDMGYTYNFITTSLGQDYGAVGPSTGGAVTEIPGWECPPIPNDSTFDSSIDLRLYSLAPVDLDDPLRVSVPVADGDNTIYPSDDDLNLAAGACATDTEAPCEKFRLNRHDFYLASFQDGYYKHPVCLYHKVSNMATGALACQIDTSKGAATLGSAALAEGGQDIIGFAAVPDANQNCPDSSVVRLPAQRKWAKLWQLRASLPARTVQDVINQPHIGDLFCTNRDIECDYLDTTAPSYDSVCNDAFATREEGPTIGPQPSAYIPPSLTSGYGNCNSSGTIGDSWATYDSGGAACTALSTGVNCCTDVGSSSPTNRAANYTLGGNWCTPTLIGSNNAIADGGIATNVWLMGNGGRHACIEADTNSVGRLKLTTFPDLLNTYELGSKTLDSSSKFDFAYVVTPPRVTIENMQNPDDPIGRQYRPYRFINGVQITYDIEAGSQNNTTNRASQFPLCVLQDTR